MAIRGMMGGALVTVNICPFSSANVWSSLRLTIRGQLLSSQTQYDGLPVLRHCDHRSRSYADLLNKRKRVRDQNSVLDYTFNVVPCPSSVFDDLGDCGTPNETISQA